MMPNWLLVSIVVVSVALVAALVWDAVDYRRWQKRIQKVYKEMQIDNEDYPPPHRL